MKRVCLLAVLFLLFSTILSMPVRAYDDDQGTVTIRNETGLKFYVVINDYNQGWLDAHDSDTYYVKYGEVKLVAEFRSKVLKKWVTLSPDNKYADWTITDDDIEYNLEDKNRWQSW